MASWLHLEEKSSESRLPPLQQKSRIPVRVTYLGIDSVRSSSSKDEGDKKERLQKDLEGKVQNKRSSRIPVIIDEKRTKVDTKVHLPKNVKTAHGEKPPGRDSGINLRETQGKQEKKKESAISLTTARYGKYCRRAKETTPNVRRRVPRQLAPMETESKQVCNDEKEPQEESSASEVASAAEVTPDFECNAAPVHEEELRMGTEADFSGSEFGDDFERLSKSSDEKAMPNVPPWLREDYKKRIVAEEQTVAKSAQDKKSYPGDASDEAKKEPEGKATYDPLETPKDICTDFVSDELDKIIAAMSVMNADMTDGEHADAMSTLLLLRDEAREREEISDNTNVMKGNTTITNSAQNIRLETETKMNENYMIEEELDCSSFTESSGYKRKMAELDEKSRRLKAQFAEENSQAIESMNKIVEEIKQSQAREGSITNEIEEMRRRQDEIKDDLKRLDEIAQRRELEDKKWKEKMDKKKKKVARRLEKIKAERRKYQEEMAAENDSTEEHDRPEENSSLKGGKCKHLTRENETVVNEDIDDKLFYEPYEIKEYRSVKELEKKRKELRRLERLEKKAIKREKLEQRERKKIEKQKRKVARNLEKLSAKNSTISKETAEGTTCITKHMEVTNTTANENFDGTPTVSRTKPYVDTTSNGAESKQFRETPSPGLLTKRARVIKLEETLAKVKIKKLVASASEVSAKVGLADESYSDSAKENHKTCDYSDGQGKRVNGNNETEMMNSEGEDTLDDISVERLSLEDFEHEENCKIQEEPVDKVILCKNFTPALSRTGSQEPSKTEKEKRTQSKPVDKDVSVSNDEESDSCVDYKSTLLSSFGQITDQTSPLTRETSGRFTQFGVQPMYGSPEMAESNSKLEDMDYTIDESVDSEQGNRNNYKEEISQQLENRPTENEENASEDQSQLMSEGSHSPRVHKPNRGNHPVTDQSTPLTQKVSRRLRTLGLQPFYRSPEVAEENPRLRDTESFIDKSVDGERSEQNPYREQALQQLEIRQAEQKVQSYSHSNNTSCGDVRKKIEEALSESSVPCAEMKQGQDMIHCEDDLTKELRNIQEKGDDQEGRPVNQFFTPNEPWPMTFTSPISSSTESNDGVKNQKEDPKFSDHFDDSDERDKDDERGGEIIFLESAAVSSELDSKVNNDLKSHSPRSPGKNKGSDLHITGQPLSHRDNFIIELDELLDKVGEDLEEDVTGDLTTKIVSGSCSLKGSSAHENADKNQSQVMSEGSGSCGKDTINLRRSPSTNQTAPLTRKVFFGLQPSHRLPEMAEDNVTLEDIDSIVDELVDSEHSGQNYSNEEVPQQFENRLTKNEVKRNNYTNYTSCSHSFKEFEEALSETGIPCSSDKMGESPDSKINYAEETRLSFKTFVSVVKQTGDDSRSENTPIEQTQVEVIYSSESPNKNSLAAEDGNKNETQLKIEGTCSQNKDTCYQLKHSSRVTNQTPPLIQKVSGGFASNGLQSTLQSPEGRASNEKLEVTTTETEELESDERSQHVRPALEDSSLPSNIKEVRKQLDDTLTEKVRRSQKSNIDATGTSCNDIPEELEEILLVSWESSHTEEEKVHKTDPHVISEEEDSHSSSAGILSTGYQEISVGTYGTKTENRKEDVGSDGSEKMCKVDGVMDDRTRYVRSVAAVVNISEYLFQKELLKALEIIMPKDKEEFKLEGSPKDKVDGETHSSRSPRDNRDSDSHWTGENHSDEDEFISEVDDLLELEEKGSLDDKTVFDSSPSRNFYECRVKKGDNVDKNETPLSKDRLDAILEIKNDTFVNQSSDTLTKSGRQQAISPLQVKKGDILDNSDGHEQKEHRRLEMGNESWPSNHQKEPQVLEKRIAEKEDKSCNDADDTGHDEVEKALIQTCGKLKTAQDNFSLMLKVNKDLEGLKNSLHTGEKRKMIESTENSSKLAEVLVKSTVSSFGEQPNKTKVCIFNTMNDKKGRKISISGAQFPPNKENAIEDEFIDEFDRFLDKVEEDIQTEESRSQIFQGAKSEGYKKNGEESSAFINDETLDECLTLVSSLESGHSSFQCDGQRYKDISGDVLENVFEKDEDSNSFFGENGHRGQKNLSKRDESVAAVCRQKDNKLSLSSALPIATVSDFVIDESLTLFCDKEVKAFSDGDLEVSSDYENEQDSRDCLDSLVNEHFQNRPCILVKETPLNKAREARYEPTALPDSKVEYTSRSGEKSPIGEFDETRKYLAEDTTETQTKRGERKRVDLPYRSADVINYNYVILIALEKLNHINLVLTDAGEQLFGRGEAYGSFEVHRDIDSGTELLNSIGVLSETAEDVIKDFKRAIQKTKEESKLHRENCEMESGHLKRENTELETHISVIKDELETYRKRIETLQGDLQESEVVVKRLLSKEEYKERELANLKRDFEGKEQKWEEGNELLRKLMVDRKELWADVDYLEGSLKNSQESNKDLTFRVDELKVTMKEMKRDYLVEHTTGGRGHLREEVELLNGSLELNEQRVALLVSQVEAFKVEGSKFANTAQIMQKEMESLKSEKAMITKQLENQIDGAKRENDRMTRELHQLTVKNKTLSEHKEENLMVISKLEDQLAKLNKENSTLTTELLKVSGKDNEDETTSIINHFRKEIVKLGEDNTRLTSELSMAYLENESLKQVNGEDELVRLRREHSITYLSAVTDKDNRWNKLKDDVLGFVHQLENKIARLLNENSTLTMELSKESERKTTLDELKCETTKTISDLKDKIVKLRKEKSSLISEISQKSEMDNQLCELRCEKSRITRKLEDDITRLNRENSTLIARLSKASENDEQLTELREKVETLTCNNIVLKEELLKAKIRSAKDVESVHNENCELRVIGNHYRRSSEIKVLKKRIRQAERELDSLRRFLRQRGLDFGERLPKDFAGGVTNESDKRDTLHRKREVKHDESQKDKVQELEEIIKDLRETLRQTESDLEHVNSDLRSKVERTERMERYLDEKEQILETTKQQLIQSKQNLGQTEATLIWLNERTEELKSQLKNLTEEAEASFKSKEKEVEEAYCSIKKQDETIKNLIEEIRQERCDKERLELQSERIRELETQLQRMEDMEWNAIYSLDALVLEARQERSEKERLKRAVEAIECSSYEEKDLEKRIGHLEDQLRERDDLTNATLTSLDKNKSSLQEANATIDTLTEQLERGKLDKETLRRAVEVSQCLSVSVSYNEKMLNDEIEKLEEHLKAMEEIRKNTLHSLDVLVLEVKQERSENDRLKRLIEAAECSSYREREFKVRFGQLEKHLEEMNDHGDPTLPSLQEVCTTVDTLSEQSEREKSDKENLRRALEAKEYNSNKGNRLTEKIKRLEKQLQEAGELREKAVRSFKEKEWLLEEAHDKIKELTRQIESHSDKGNKLAEKIEKLERKLQEMSELREKTVRSLKEKEWSLEEAHDETKELTRQVAHEKSEKEYVMTWVEGREGIAKREKELLENTEKLENELRKMNERQDKTLAALKVKQQKLEEMYDGIERKDNKVRELTKELQRERSKKLSLRKAIEKAKSKAQQQRELLYEKDNETDKLKESLYDYKEKVENLNVNLKKLTKEVEIARELLAYKNNDEGNLLITSIKKHNRQNLVLKGTKRNTQEIDSFMAQVGKRLKNLVKRQTKVYASSLIIKEKEAHTESLLDKMTEDLNNREKVIEDLRISFQDSSSECLSTRQLLEDVQLENADLKQRLVDKDDKLRTLEITIKQLEGDLQKTHKYLKERDVGVVEAHETLQLKCSLLTTVEAKLCLRTKEIEVLTQTNKEKGLEITRIETTLREVKKELDIAASIIEKQNEECANLKTSAMRKTRDAEEMQDELKRLSTQLECARNEKANLHKAVLAATSRLENERFFAEREQRALQGEVNSSLKELNTKSKQFWDMKMDLREAVARIFILEDEKAEQEENLLAFKGKVSRELDMFKEKQCAENNEKESSLQLTIGSAGREMARLTKEKNNHFRIELFQNGLENKSSSCKENTFSNVGTRKGNATYQIPFLEDESNMVASSHEDCTNKWLNTPRLEKRFETRGDRLFNRTSTIAEVECTMQNLTDHIMAN